MVSFTLNAQFSTDLRQELHVKELEKKKPEEFNNKENKEPEKLSTPVKKDSETPSNQITHSIGTSPLHTAYGTSPLTPSARISALNIVGDLLRKVGVSM